MSFDIAPLHPTHATETTPLFYAALMAHNTRGIVADLPHVPRCRPTERRLRILNNGTGVHGAVVWNA